MRLADLTAGHSPEVVTIAGTDVPVDAITAVRRSGSRVEVRLPEGRIVGEDLDSDGLTEWSLLLAAIDEHGNHRGVWTRGDGLAPDWDAPARHPQPVGIAEIADMLDTPRGTVDSWRHRGDLPEPRWTVGGRPAWDAADIRRWTDRIARQEEQ